MKNFTLLIFFVSLFLTITAQIEITNIPDTTIYAPINGFGSETYELDVNDDNFTDFVVTVKKHKSNEGNHPPYDAYLVYITGTGVNEVHNYPVFTTDTVSSSLSFSNRCDIFGLAPELGRYGLWSGRVSPVNSFANIGLRIQINGNWHYGYVRLKTDSRKFTIDLYAYETKADEKIIIN